MSTLVRACDCNWLLRFLWGSEFEIETKNRSVCENDVTGIWGSCRLPVMGSWRNMTSNILTNESFTMGCFLSWEYPCYSGLNWNSFVLYYKGYIPLLRLTPLSLRKQATILWLSLVSLLGLQHHPPAINSAVKWHSEPVPTPLLITWRFTYDRLHTS